MKLSLFVSRMIFLTMVYFVNPVITYAQKLPTSWQPGMALTTYFGSGMRDQTDHLRIAADSSFEKHSGEDNNKNYVFHFSAQELNDLLHFLQQKHFDKINTGVPVPVYDGWSSDITLSWPGGYIGINTGAGYKIPEKYQQDQADIENYILKLVNGKKKLRK